MQRLDRCAAHLGWFGRNLGVISKTASTVSGTHAASGATQNPNPNTQSHPMSLQPPPGRSLSPIALAAPAASSEGVFTQQQVTPCSMHNSVCTAVCDACIVLPQSADEGTGPLIMAKRAFEVYPSVQCVACLGLYG